MAGGLRFESLADMPEGMRKLAAKKVVEMGKQKTGPGTVSTSPEKSKYHNIGADRNGIRFDSRKEARRYDYLMYCMEQGFIKDLRLQEEFTLQPAYTTPEGERIRAIRYLADFTYIIVRCPLDPGFRIEEEDREYWRSRRSGEKVVEDVKSQGTRTDKYIMKKKMMADRFGIQIREV